MAENENKKLSENSKSVKEKKATVGKELMSNIKVNLQKFISKVKEYKKKHPRRFYAGLSFSVLLSLGFCILFVFALTTILSNFQKARELNPVFTLAKELEEEYGVNISGNKFTVTSPVAFASDVKKDDIVIEPSISYNLSTNDRDLVIEPQEDLRQDQTYKVILKEGVKLEDGKITSKAYEWVFRTVPKFDVTGITPRDGTSTAPSNTAIEFEFTYKDLNVEEFKKYFSIKPEVAGKFKVEGRKIIFMPNQELNPNSTYLVNLEVGFGSSEHGYLEEEKSSEFKVVQHEDSSVMFPYLYLTSRSSISTFYKEPFIFMYYNNLGADIGVTAYEANYEALTEAYSSDSHFGELKRPSDKNLKKVKDISVRPVQGGGSQRVDLDFLPAGLFFVEVKSGDHLSPSYIFIVNSEKGLYVTSEQSQMQGWLFDVKNGSLMTGADIKVFAGGNTKDLRTDKSGKFVFDDDDFRVVAYIKDDKVLSALNYGHEYFGYEEYDFSTTSDANGDIYRTYVYTDRPLYQAGDVVNYKIIMRKEDDMKFALPENMEVIVRLGDFDYSYNYSKKAPIVEQKVTINSGFGTASGSFVIPPNSKTGDMYLNVVKDEKILAGDMIGVYTYVKPKFEVSAEAPQMHYYIGETGTAVVQANYYSGQPAAYEKAKVNIYCAEPNEEDWPENNDYLSVSDYYWGEKVEERDITLDANGKATIKFKGKKCPRQNVDTNLVKYGVEINMQDNADYPTRGGTAVYFHKKKYNAFAKVEGVDSTYNLKVGSDVKVKFKVVNTMTFDPIKNREVAVYGYRVWYKKIQVDTRYDELTKQVIPVYDYKYYSDEVNLGFDSIKTNSNGEFTITVKNPKWGTYGFTIYQYGGDDKKGPDKGYDNLFSVQKEEAEETQVASYWEQYATVSFDKEEYSIGDTAKITVESEIDSDAVFMIYRGNIYYQENISLKKGQKKVISREITDEFFPNIYASVVFTSPASAPEYASQGYRMISQAVGWADINDEDKKLYITLSSDKKEYVPGDTVTLNVESKNSQDKGVSSEVSLSVVDKALLDLTSPYYWLEEEGGFYDEAFDFFTSARHYTSSFQTHYDPSPFGGKGDTSGGGLGETRDEFPDMAYWNAVVKTDENGKGTVQFTLPGNLTSWQVQGVGVTKDTLVGSARTDFDVSMDKYVDLSLSPYIREGDKMTVEATIHNFSSRAANFEVYVEAEGLNVKGFDQKNVSVGAGSATDLNFRITPDLTKDIGKIKIGIKEGGKVVDEVVKEISVFKLGRLVNTTYGKFLESENSAETAFEVDDLERTYVTLLLSNSLLNVEHVRTYISVNSTVQLSNSLIKNTALYKYYDKINPDISREDLEKEIDYAMNLIKQNQAANGGLGWFDYDAVNTETTALAALAMAYAKDAGFELGDEFETKLINFLRAELDSEKVTYDEKFLILYALSGLGDEYGLPYVTYAVSQIDQYQDSPQALVYLALALYNYEDTGDGMLVVEKLKDIALNSDRMTQWQDKDVPFRILKDDVFLTALAYDALKKYGDEDAIVQNVQNYLVENPVDVYSNSIAAVIAYRALTVHNLDKLEGEETGYKVYVNDQLVKEDTLNDSSQVELVVSSEDLQKGENKIRVEKNGKMLYVRVMVNSYAAKIKGETEFKMTRKFINFASDAEQTSFKQGDYVKVQVSVKADRDGYFLDVYDYLPAGFMPIQFQLQGVDLATRQKWWTWTGEPINKFGEVTSDYVEFDELKFKKGKTYKFEYLMQAAVKGEYNTNGSQSFVVGSPDVNGDVSNSIIKID